MLLSILRLFYLKNHKEKENLYINFLEEVVKNCKKTVTITEKKFQTSLNKLANVCYLKHNHEVTKEDLDLDILNALIFLVELKAKEDLNEFLEAEEQLKKAIYDINIIKQFIKNICISKNKILLYI